MTTDLIKLCAFFSQPFAHTNGHNFFIKIEIWCSPYYPILKGIGEMLLEILWTQTATLSYVKSNCDLDNWANVTRSWYVQDSLHGHHMSKFESVPWNHLDIFWTQGVKPGVMCKFHMLILVVTLQIQPKYDMTRILKLDTRCKMK